MFGSAFLHFHTLFFHNVPLVPFLVPLTKGLLLFEGKPKAERKSCQPLVYAL